jgi:hypothetical protein
LLLLLLCSIAVYACCTRYEGLRSSSIASAACLRVTLPMLLRAHRLLLILRAAQLL